MWYNKAILTFIIYYLKDSRIWNYINKKYTLKIDIKKFNGEK